MGCDVHGVVEVRRSNLASRSDALWEGVINLDGILMRDYDRFAYLFGVRHYPDEQDLPHSVGSLGDRGMPYDPSDMTEGLYERWEADAHSQTWAYHHEIESVLVGTRFLDDPEGVVGEAWQTAFDCVENIDSLFGENPGTRDHETRWVIWFDN